MKRSVDIVTDEMELVRLEREAIQTEEPAETFIDFAPTFLATEDPPLEYIIPELTPKGVLKLSHGDPRTMKTFAAQEEAVAVATCTPCFGLERFRPIRSRRVLYSSQEDVARTVRPRFKGLLLSRGITDFPETLAFAVHKGIDFDSPEWRERFYNDVVLFGFELVIIDPIRAYTANADKGPAEVMPIAKYFRRFIQLGITIHGVHHDTKPPANGPDNRRRSHRASGGAWFSVSECPVSFEKLSERQSLVTPEDYKFSSDPQPFTIEYRESDSPAGKLIYLVGESSSAQEAQDLAIDEKILTYLAENQGAKSTAIAKALKGNKQNVVNGLERLRNANRVDYIEKGRSKLWTVRRGE